MSVVMKMESSGVPVGKGTGYRTTRNLVKVRDSKSKIIARLIISTF